MLISVHVPWRSHIIHTRRRRTRSPMQQSTSRIMNRCNEIVLITNCLWRVRVFAIFFARVPRVRRTKSDVFSSVLMYAKLHSSLYEQCYDWTIAFGWILSSTCFHLHTDMDADAAAAFCYSIHIQLKMTPTLRIGGGRIINSKFIFSCVRIENKWLNIYKNEREFCKVKNVFFSISAYFFVWNKNR